MAIDPMMYERLSGRKGDPYTRMGETLAKEVKSQRARDEMPKGTAGGMRVNLAPGVFANIWFAIKDFMRRKDD